MAVIDLNDPQAMKDAIASGLVWSAPTDAKITAAQMIADGKVPMPSYLPDDARAVIARMKGVSIDDIQPATDAEGSGPV